MLLMIEWIKFECRIFKSICVRIKMNLVIWDIKGINLI